MAQHADDAEALIEQLSDLARTLQDYADALEFNPVRLAEVEERLELIASLKRKYGDTIEQINAFGMKARQRVGGTRATGKPSTATWSSRKINYCCARSASLALQLSQQRQRRGRADPGAPGRAAPWPT
jgi:DNA repair protein RecN (Recombination protein N)